METRLEVKVLTNYEMHSLLESTLSIDNGKGGLILEAIFNLVPCCSKMNKCLKVDVVFLGTNENAF